jgi:hypothetical protein
MSHRSGCARARTGCGKGEKPGPRIAWQARLLVCGGGPGEVDRHIGWFLPGRAVVLTRCPTAPPPLPRLPLCRKRGPVVPWLKRGASSVSGRPRERPASGTAPCAPGRGGAPEPARSEPGAARYPRDAVDRYVHKAALIVDSTGRGAALVWMVVHNVPATARLMSCGRGGWPCGRYCPQISAIRGDRCRDARVGLARGGGVHLASAVQHHWTLLVNSAVARSA